MGHANARIVDAIFKKYANVNDNVFDSRQKYYHVECLRDRRERTGKGGRTIIEFLIKWKGHPQSANTLR